MENKRENFNEEVSLKENSAKANNAEMAKKTILVVDDEKPIVDILTYNLQKEGYSTLEANDGEEAIKIAYKYAIIVPTKIKTQFWLVVQT